MNSWNRRRFLKTATLGLAGSALGCQGQTASQGNRSENQLKIFVYAGGHDQTMREVFVPAFEAQTGAKALLFPGWWDGIPKLKTAPANDPPFDLMITDATQGYPAAREGLFSTINFAAVPNQKMLAPASLDHWIFRDRVGLPYPDSTMTLAYDKRQLANPEPGWSLLLQSTLSGKIGLYTSFYMSLFTFAAILADADGKAGTAHELLQSQPDSVFEFAREHRKRVKLWWPTSTDMILALNERSVAAGNMHSPEYLLALREKPDLGAIVPDRDRAMVQVFWAIPTGTRQKELAEQALNVLFSEDVQLGFARRGMATPRADVASRMASEDPIWKNLYPHTDEQFRDLKYYPYDFYSEHWDDFADRWDRTILRDG